MIRVIYVMPYGSYVNKLYLPECDTARLFCELLKQKTLTAENLEVIKKLGYEIRTKETVL